MSPYDLTGHRAVVIGAGGALGRATCTAYAELGATVLAFDRDQDLAEAAIAPLPGRSHHAAVLDVREERSVEEGVAVAASGGPVDSVVYAAGVTATGDVAGFSFEVWRTVLAVNLDGAFLCARAFSRHLVDAGRPASLAFLASTAGLRGEAGASAYCASKFGLIGLVRSLTLEVARAGIRVNAVCPGDVDSEMLGAVAVAQAARTGTTAQALMREYAAAVPRGRLVDPLEVGRAIAWLATPAADGVSGLSLPVDAGALAA